ncbi:MaoC family dehydratase [Diaminobutyricimonas sp. LJ205]|uniref:MaoC family dehydratase n=1 Tax=Diaminobutyricimonas sp. LJ205 TaxID=2683590 RepID=UPI0012F48249|nr:MaoC family dehydratase [Diaminobutyricimonas sp. LJ205]
MRADEGPYFDELKVGDTFDSAPSLTLTSGRAAAHQAILGSRLRLSLDAHLSRATAGVELADPAFVWDVAIGQSTVVTRRVIANLFYRGLAFHHLPSTGDTLHTLTEVVGLRQASSRPAGLAALRVTTRDQDDRLVLDFWRCAMLPLSSPDVRTGFSDDLGTVGSEGSVEPIMNAVRSWNLDALPDAPTIVAGDSWALNAGDVVTSAPELARLTLNVAHVHHDRFAQPNGRLVYGGHTIGIALAQVTRTLPDIITVAAWHSCDHSGPVREGDTLASTISVEDVAEVGEGLRALTLRVLVYAKRAEAQNDQVLDWRFVALSR